MEEKFLNYFLFIKIPLFLFKFFINENFGPLIKLNIFHLTL